MPRAADISPFCEPAEEAAPPEQADAGAALSCARVGTAAELAIHFAIRRAVFVEEQRFFETTDRDAHDDDPSTIHVLGLSGQVAGGAVRLYELEEPGVWKGDRLAVLPAFRRRGLGAPLVRFAVACAGDLGGRVMVAHVQLSNVPFFRRLGWWEHGHPLTYVGRLHQVMAIDLAPSR